ncbi:ribonuclease H-like domain-containing protein [Mycena filopes]|nr:ribonuclease H-like domain-containing protein [Mycena filopes]
MSTLPKNTLRKAAGLFRAKPRTISNSNKDLTEGVEAKESQAFPETYTVTELSTEYQVNNALREIKSGVVGVDTEFTERTPTDNERLVMGYFPYSPGQRKGAITGLQIIELHTGFDVAWDNVSIRLIQVAYKDTVWVIDMRAVKSIPKELKRVLQSPDITKAGVGLIKDIAVIWDDLRLEMKNLVDVGMMAKLTLAEKHGKIGYGNLSLKVSVEDILGYKIDKELSQSDWAPKKLSDNEEVWVGPQADLSGVKVVLAGGRALEEEGK